MSSLATPTTGGFTRDAVLRHSERLDEPAWLRERRLAAWEAYERLPEPWMQRPEEWRRTDVRGLDLAAFALPQARELPRTPLALGAIGRDPDRRAGLVTHIDGQIASATLAAAESRRGVVFADLGAAARAHGDLVAAHLGIVAATDEHRFQALQAALWSGGTFVYVPAGVEVALPLIAQTWLGRPGAALFPRTLVVAEEGSAVTLLEVQASAPAGAPTLAIGTVELIVGRGARVRHAVLQEWGAPMREVGSLIRARLDRDATLHSLVVALGGGVVKLDVEARLAGQGASAEMLGVYFGAGQQHMDFHTRQEHQAPSTTSDLLYRGAVRDEARAVFSGLIRVEPGAQKTNAFQANRNLILSPGARTDSIPKLEIMANDLRCTHGSATSRLNEEHIFYLMSRGLTRQRATLMIVEGFFSDILDRLPLEPVRAYLGARIAEKMM